MTLLIAGLALWIAAHVFKRVAPAKRAAMGNAGRGMVTGMVVVSLILMVVGYRTTDPVLLYALPGFVFHLNNLLMLIAVYLFAVSGARTRLAQHVRHPMLTGMATWGVAHLLVNGDLADVILFGTLTIWAFATQVVINRSEAWTPPPAAPRAKEIRVVVISLVVYAVIGAVHALIGPTPFGAG